MDVKKVKLSKVIYWIISIFIAALVISSLVFCHIDSYESVSIDNIRSIIIDMMGLIVASVLLFGLSPDSLGEKSNRSLARLIVVMCMIMYVDLRYSFMEGRIGVINVSLTQLKIEYTLLEVFHDMMLYCYWTYVREEVGLKGRSLTVGNFLCRILTGISIIIEVLNPVFGWYTSFDKYGNLTIGRVRIYADMIAVVVFVITIVVIVTSKEHPLREKITLLSFEIFPLIAVGIGVLSGEYSLLYMSYLMSLLVIYINIFTKHRNKIAEQQVLLEKQSTALMISQIQPHFLYNILTTISNLCMKDPKEARDTTVMFSRYLRTNLDSLSKEGPVPFAEELDHIKIYVDLEKKRFRDRLSVNFDIEAVDFVVPSLGLQPLAENAIKHGICQKEEAGNLTISSRKVEGGNLVVIEDDGVGFDPSTGPEPDGKSHVGLENTVSRLEKMCDAKVTITSSLGNGCRVEVLFPENHRI